MKQSVCPAVSSANEGAEAVAFPTNGPTFENNRERPTAVPRATRQVCEDSDDMN